jgi:hypothetical protein
MLDTFLGEIMFVDQQLEFPPREVPLLFGASQSAADKSVNDKASNKPDTRQKKHNYRARWWSADRTETEWSPPFMRKPR